MHPRACKWRRVIGKTSSAVRSLHPLICSSLNGPCQTCGRVATAEFLRSAFSNFSSWPMGVASFNWRQFSKESEVSAGMAHSPFKSDKPLLFALKAMTLGKSRRPSRFFSAVQSFTDSLCKFSPSAGRWASEVRAAQPSNEKEVKPSYDLSGCRGSCASPSSDRRFAQRCKVKVSSDSQYPRGWTEIRPSHSCKSIDLSFVAVLRTPRLLTCLHRRKSSSIRLCAQASRALRSFNSGLSDRFNWVIRGE